MSVYDELSQAESEFHQRSGQARLVVTQLRETQGEIESLGTRIEDLSKIVGVLNAYADERQAVVQSQIEQIVSQGLQTIFGEDLNLRVVTKQVGSRTEVDFVLVSSASGETLETSILDSRGGGVAAVAGFLIQAVIVLLTPGLRPVLFLDEVFSQVSRGYLAPLADFISELCERSPLQVVLVTHSEEFEDAADLVYRFTQKSGITQVEEVKT